MILFDSGGDGRPWEGVTPTELWDHFGLNEPYVYERTSLIHARYITAEHAWGLQPQVMLCRALVDVV